MAGDRIQELVSLETLVIVDDCCHGQVSVPFSNECNSNGNSGCRSLCTEFLRRNSLSRETPEDI
jgi:hypothetical protein